MKTILIACAHPDDEVLGMPGTIASMASSGAKVYVLHCFEGSTSRAFTNTSSPLTEHSQLHTAIAERMKLSVLCGQLLGYEVLDPLHLPNFRSSVEDKLFLNSYIASIIPKLSIDTVFTHFNSDLNSDHCIVSDSVRVATRPLSQPAPSVFEFEVLSTTEYSYKSQFLPNYFCPVDMHLSKVQQAFSVYNSEMRSLPHPRNFESYRSRARLRGSLCGCNYAEGFATVRHLFPDT